MKLIARVVHAIAALGCLIHAAPADRAVIEECRYASDAAAQAAWKPMQGSAEVNVATVAGRKALRLTCNYAGSHIERASWDRTGKLDLAPYQGIQFEFFTQNSAPVSHYNIYFQSGSGWYSASFFPASKSGWETIHIDKAATRTEGNPAGWGSVQTIRISAWRGRDENTEFYISDIRGIGALGVDASVAIVRAEAEGKNEQEYAAGISSALAALGIRAATLSDSEITAEKLRAAKIVILPHNPTLPDRAAVELIQYLHNGGKLMVFYNLPAKLRQAVRIESGSHIRAQSAGQFAAIRFASGALAGAPANVGQRSWNIIEAKPVSGVSRTLAEWFDDKGQPSGYPAVVASANCIWMTHVLLKDDAVNKRRMLMAMVGQLAPELWRQSVSASIAQIGPIGPAKNFDEAAALIGRAKIAPIRKLRDEASALNKRGKYVEASDKAAAVSGKLAEAFAKAQKPQPGEFRAFWCHSAMGVEGMDWNEAIRRLADNGFTAILPNMLWAGAAFYDSAVLPVASDVAQKGDQIAQCLTACRKYGVEMHVWKVNFNLGRAAPVAFVERMRNEGRLQASLRGVEEPWLCPSHPENQKLEVASMVELVRKYGIDGIHFDYIRYPDNSHCFCNGCRERFSKAANVTIAQWPRDVTDGDLRQEWLEWRRSQITAVVKAVSEQARALNPKIKISAAVFRNWSVDRDGVGQDWKLWCDKGYLDFVCPMDYSESDRQFDGWISSQKEWAGKTPVYPGIGASATSSHMGADRVIGQIQITRDHQTGGFVIFNYGVTEAKELLPMLGLGITAKPKP